MKSKSKTFSEYNSPFEEEVEIQEESIEPDFLDDLNNQNFKESIPEVKTKAPKAEKPDEYFEEFKNKKKAKKSKKEDPLFSDEPTPIQGKEILILKTKISEYKALFPAELKSFKIKKNPSLQDLEDVLKEMEAIVSCGTVDSFVTDSILQIVRMTEGMSQRFNNMDITGTADALKSNKQFHSLCKLLYVKYRVFSEIPAEVQLIMIVSTTAYMCSMSNKKLKTG